MIPGAIKWGRVGSGGVGWRRVGSGGVGWGRLASGGVGSVGWCEVGMSRVVSDLLNCSWPSAAQAFLFPGLKLVLQLSAHASH